MPIPPTNVLIQYTMVGQLLTNSGPNAYQLVYWDVYNAADYAGQYSGYFGQLQNIAIATTTSISSPTSGAVTPTSPAGGDLGGNYPNPTVIGIQSFPVSTTPPVAGQSLVYNGTLYVPGNPVAAIWTFISSSTASHGTPDNPPARGPQLFFLCNSNGGLYSQQLPVAPNINDICGFKDVGTSGATPAQSGIYANTITISGAPYTVQDKHTMAFDAGYPWGAASGDAGGDAFYILFTGSGWVVI